MIGLAIVVFAVQLVPPFGVVGANATVVDSATVRIAVTVGAGEGSSVVVHGLEPGGEQRTVAMVESSPGIYSTTFETRPIDLVLIFEDVETGDQSDPIRLSELGAVIEPEIQPRDAPIAESNSSLGWLALALGAGALSLLAFWALGGNDPASKRDEHDEPPEPTDQL